jgi:hypothetical protein
LLVGEFRTDDAFGPGRSIPELVTGIRVSGQRRVQGKPAGNFGIHIANLDGIEFGIADVELFEPLLRGKKKLIEARDGLIV